MFNEVIQIIMFLFGRRLGFGAETVHRCGVRNSILMNVNKTVLSSRGLANVQCETASPDFTFIVGSGRYQCPSVVAEFLSPRASQLHAIDATINKLSLDI
jgi:hypothetical protein